MDASNALLQLPAVLSFRTLSLPCSTPPWSSSNLRVNKHDRITWLATGQMILNESLDLRMSAVRVLWARIGKGRVFKGRKDTTTFTANESGTLELGVSAGQWVTENGDLDTPQSAYTKLKGGLEVLLIRWATNAEPIVELDKLARLISPSDPFTPLVLSERDRLLNPVTQPALWSYLWFLGDGDIFGTTQQNEKQIISVNTSSDVGILQTPISVPFTSSSQLSWSWNIAQLPTTVPENGPLVHDYISIAVAFSNGLDLTYYWSSTLPVGTHYRCPLSYWKDKEFHLVVRSGQEGLGEWFSERRNIAKDYEEVIGGKAPERVTGVWLIANSVFKRGVGKGMFADIVVENGASSRAVL
jgi:hypothetical protein